MSAQEFSEEQLANVHPFAMWVIDQLELRKGSPDDVFTDEDTLELAKGLEGLLGREELRHAVVSLLNLAATLEANGSVKTARAMYDLMQREQILDALKKLNGVRDDENEDKKAEGKKAFERLSGKKDGLAKPAKVGEERPEDSVTLDGLKFPRRL